jgi:hypothetical protein
VQLQRESPKSSGEVPLEPLGVLAMLEAQHEVVGVPDDHDVALGAPSPLLDPQVEDVVEVDVWS